MREKLKERLRRVFSWFWGAPVLFFFLTAAIYGPSLFFDFVYDDIWTILQNPALNQVTPIKRFFLDPATSASSQTRIGKDVYRPLASLSFALNKKWGGLNPAGFRLVNIFIHWLAGLFLWLILARFFPFLPAFIGTLVFLFHPIQTESVVWITQRSILLSGLGVLASLWFWERSGDSEKSSLKWRWLAVAAFGMALLGKEAALPLPLIFLIMMFHRKEKLSWPLVASFVVATGYFIFRRMVMGRWGQDQQIQIPLLRSLEEGFCALPVYIRNIFSPSSLNVSYPWQELGNCLSLPFLLGIFILLILVVDGVMVWKKDSRTALGIFIFVSFWLPYSGILPLITFAADRFMYLSFIGLAFLMARLAQRMSKPLVLLLVPFLLSIITVSRVRDWKDEVQLWRASVRANPRNSFAHACLAQSYLQRGDLESAERHFERALGNRPGLAVAAVSMRALIRINQKQGDVKNAAIWQRNYNQFMSQAPHTPPSPFGLRRERALEKKKLRAPAGL